MFSDLSRFLFSRKNFSSEKNIVKARAFAPDKENKTSVFGISGLEEAEVWEIGRDHVGVLRGAQLLGWAGVLEKAVRKLGLEIVPDTTSHSRHANIEGWPEKQDERKDVAWDLAQEATLHLPKNS